MLAAEQKYIDCATIDKERAPGQEIAFNRARVKLSSIPIDALYNSSINKMKGTSDLLAMNPKKNAYMPIEFKIE